jgi:glutamate-1-semialdehyde 2,1-aminomutase
MNGFDPKRPGAWPHAGTFNNNILTMSAGYAGLTEVYTEAAALELNARGEALRRRLNAIGAEAEVAMQFTGIGSMFAVHFTRAAITAPADDAGGDRLKELFFFDLLARGIWIARRGMSALSLPIGEDECAQCAEAVESFVQTRRSLLVG